MPRFDTTREAVAPPGAGRHRAGMVFLCGFPGGGTDLLMSVLNAHPGIFIPGEFPFLPRLGDRYGAMIPAAELDRLVRDFHNVDVYRTFRNHHYVNFQRNRKDEIERPPPPPPEQGSYALATIYQWLLGVPPEVVWTGNKTPSNTEHIDRMTRMFPEARFIIVTRDVRDVVLTWKRKWGKDPLLTAWKYETRMRLGLEHVERLDEGRTLFVKFERLLTDLEEESRRMCEFLELEWDRRMIEFHEHTTKTIAGKPNWGAPLIPENRGKWRRELDEGTARRVEEIAYRAMTSLDYEPALASSPRPLRRRERAVGRIRDLYATVAVDNRYQRTNRARDRARNVLLNVRKLTTQRSIRR